MERELLQHLANVTIPDWCNLGIYFKEHYPEHSQARLKDIKVLLDELVHEKKLIRLSDATQYQILGSETDVGYGMQLITFDVLHAISHDVFGKINTAGRSYLAEIIRNEKQDALNESFKKMNEETIPNQNTAQNRINNKSFYAIVASALFALGSILTTLYIHKVDTEKSPQLQSIPLTLDSLRQTLERMDSSLKTMSLDSVKKVKIVKK